MVKLMQFFISCLFLNALQVYSTVTKLQNGEEVARKAGNGIFPHLSYVGKNQIKAQNKYSTSDRIAADLDTEQPGGGVIEDRSIRYYFTQEACKSRTFQPSRVGWTLSSVNQNQAMACAQK